MKSHLFKLLPIAGAVLVSIFVIPSVLSNDAAAAALWQEVPLPYHGHEVLIQDTFDYEICLAKNIYFEAGNQPLAGKIAVANVTLNRLQHSSYPDDVCGVVYQAKWKENWKGNMLPVRNKCQFSWFCDGKPDDVLDTKTWISSLDVATDTMNGYYPDITEGATHYHAMTVKPYWAKILNMTVIINDHIFYK